jgi:hypothetical protein
MDKNNFDEKFDKELIKIFNDPDVIKVLGKDYI